MIKSGKYICINNDFKITMYPDTPTDFKLIVGTEYFLRFEEKFFDIFGPVEIYGTEPYCGYVTFDSSENLLVINNDGIMGNYILKDKLSNFKDYFITLAEWRERQINSILYGDED